MALLLYIAPPSQAQVTATITPDPTHTSFICKATGTYAVPNGNANYVEGWSIFIDNINGSGPGQFVQVATGYYKDPGGFGKFPWTITVAVNTEPNYVLWGSHTCIFEGCNNPLQLILTQPQPGAVMWWQTNTYTFPSNASGTGPP